MMMNTIKKQLEVNEYILDIKADGPWITERSGAMNSLIKN